MTKPSLPVLAICLLAATAASGQSMGGARHSRGGQGAGAPAGAPANNGAGPPATRDVAPDKADIVGVVQAIDPAADRVTIAYQPVEALNWPAGSKPFEVAKSALLAGVTVGQKVRFRLESQQIYVLQPF